MKLKNKLLILFLVFIFLFFILNTNVFASDIDISTLPEFPLITDATDLEYVIYCLGDSKFRLIAFYSTSGELDYKLVYNPSSSIGQSLTFTNNSDNILKYNVYTLSDNNWSVSSRGIEVSSNTSGERQLTPNPPSSTSVNFIYSDKNIYDINNQIFFQAPPQARVILAPIVEGTETKKTLAEVVEILPTILVVVVSFLGLRKALKMLSMLLHRS